MVCVRRIALFLAAAVVMLPMDALAFKKETEFTAADVGYQLFDLVINKGLYGPIGWVAVAVLIIFGLYMLGKGRGEPAIYSMGAGVLIKLVPSIMTTLGITLYQVFPVGGDVANTVGRLIW
jgi:hypothetical protein